MLCGHFPSCFLNQYHLPSLLQPLFLLLFYSQSINPDTVATNIYWNARNIMTNTKVLKYLLFYIWIGPIILVNVSVIILIIITTCVKSLLTLHQQLFYSSFTMWAKQSSISVKIQTIMFNIIVMFVVYICSLVFKICDISLNLYTCYYKNNTGWLIIMVVFKMDFEIIK